MPKNIIDWQKKNWGNFYEQNKKSHHHGIGLGDSLASADADCSQAPS